MRKIAKIFSDGTTEKNVEPITTIRLKLNKNKPTNYNEDKLDQIIIILIKSTFQRLSGIKHKSNINH